MVMNVLLLSPYADKISIAVEKSGDCVTVKEGKIELSDLLDSGVDFIVSYGYRHIIGSDIADHFQGRALNLHISLLPRCRGAHPNFWSIVEGGSSGVTIHLIDRGLDTGAILLQKRVDIDYQKDTFASSYQRLSATVELLFEDNWPLLRIGGCKSRNQSGTSSYHRAKEFNEWTEFMPAGWETPIRRFLELSYNKRTSLRNLDQ